MTNITNDDKATYVFEYNFQQPEFNNPVSLPFVAPGASFVLTFEGDLGGASVEILKQVTGLTHSEGYIWRGAEWTIIAQSTNADFPTNRTTGVIRTSSSTRFAIRLVGASLNTFIRVPRVLVSLST